jgi:CBS domain-containing protein
MVRLVLADKSVDESLSQHLDEIAYFRTKTFQLTNVREVIDFSRRNPFHTLPSEAPLTEAVSMFAAGVHRILITSPHGRIVNVLSQSDIVRYLYQDPTSVFEGLDTKVSDLGLLARKVVVVSRKTPAIDAFFTMHRLGLNNVGIVDPDQGYQLVGSLSASDVAVLADFQMTKLKEPVSSFLSLLQERKPLVTVGPLITLRFLLRKLAQHWVHRVYAVDEQQRPVGIITLTDVTGIMARAVGAQAVSRALIPYDQTRFQLVKTEKEAEFKARFGAQRATGTSGEGQREPTAALDQETLRRRLQMAKEAEAKKGAQPQEKAAAPSAARPQWIHEVA